MDEKEKKSIINILTGLNPKLQGIVQIVKRIDSKLDVLIKNNNNRNVVVANNVPNIVPDISGKQIVNMAAMGWTVDQISWISGYSQDKVVSMYNKSKGLK